MMSITGSQSIGLPDQQSVKAVILAPAAIAYQGAMPTGATPDKVELTGTVKAAPGLLPELGIQSAEAASRAGESIKRNVEEIEKQASKLLTRSTGLAIDSTKWLFLGASLRRFRTRTIDFDPSPVNHPLPAEIQRAKVQLVADAQAEQSWIAKLAPGDRERYQELIPLLQHSPMARRAWQKLLLDGRLPGNKDSLGQETLLAHLHALSRQPLARRVDRQKLISELISEIEEPVRIDQRGKDTCAATNGQILLARKNPAEYVRLLRGLAAPAGKVQMHGGHYLERSSDWNASNDGKRSVSARLIIPSLMSEGQLFRGERYNNTQDRNELWFYDRWFVSFGSGLLLGSSRINSQLQGRNYHNQLFLRWNRQQKWQELKAAVNQGKGPIPVAMSWDGDGDHVVQIYRIAQGRIHYTNSWGQQESMSEKEFSAHVISADIPD
ncbi:MAG: hypothetical protein HY692_01865 [Cyanobacteria bacterium NC_groundwater_1444_Ag_S-0.65um_54_12]|nr:hypothetical protein [Cyanobacteria bacterium NC_groundwater_1444_Ag_S-0.65um_54_12]